MPTQASFQSAIVQIWRQVEKFFVFIVLNIGPKKQVYVLPDKQRYGIGGRLIEAVVDIARLEGADGLWLSVWEDAPWAVNAYRKNGFEAVGTAAFCLGKTRYKDLLMWRSV